MSELLGRRINTLELEENLRVVILYI